MNIHNDITFWTNYISQGKEGAFLLRPNLHKDIDESLVEIPEIVLSSKLPVVIMHDVVIGGQYVEPDEVEDIEEIETELEQLAEDQQTENADGN